MTTSHPKERRTFLCDGLAHQRKDESSMGITLMNGHRSTGYTPEAHWRTITTEGLIDDGQDAQRSALSGCTEAMTAHNRLGAVQHPKEDNLIASFNLHPEVFSRQCRRVRWKTSGPLWLSYRSESPSDH